MSNDKRERKRMADRAYYAKNRATLIAKSSEYYYKNRAVLAAKNAEYRRANKLEKARRDAEYYRLNKDAIKSRKAVYYASEHGKEMMRLSSERQRARAKKEEAKARELLNARVKAGLLSRPSACSTCGVTGKRIVGHHHRGYTQQYVYDVVWLCDRCHHAEHRRLRSCRAS